MKSNLVRVSILVVGAAACAQSMTPLQATIPFNFTACGQKLQAGEYSVDTQTPMLVILRSRSLHTTTVVSTVAAQSASPQKESRLVFHRYGNQYFLSDIWIPGTNFGRHIPSARKERNLAKRQAEPGEIVIARLQ